MAAPTFPIFQQARLQYRAAAPLHNFTADLGQLLEADSRIAHLEQNLTDRQKDRRRFHKIENLKPKLDRRIEKLRKEIHDEQQKIKKVKQEVNQVEWWTNKFQSMTGQTGALTEAEGLVKIVKDDFIKEFKLPVEIFDHDWIAEYQKYVADPTHKPSTPDFFETADNAILDIFANCNGIVKAHPSGRGFTIASIVECLQAFKSDLDDLHLQSEEAEQNHEQELTTLRGEHASAVDGLQDDLKNAKENGEEWEESASKAILAHRDCGQVEEERDLLKEKEAEFDAAVRKVQTLEQDLETARAERDAAVEQRRLEEQSRQAAENELSQIKSNRPPLESDIEALNEDLEQERAKLEEEQAAREEVQAQLTAATERAAATGQNSQDLLALSKQLVHCYVHFRRHPEQQMPMDISLFLPLISEPDFNLTSTIVNRTMPPISLVTMYADADLATNYDLYTLVAECIGLPVQPAEMDLLGRAIVLERSIMPELTKGNHSAKAASLVYRHAIHLATSDYLRGDAFVSLCSSLETMYQWFPHADPAEYTALMESILVQRYSGLPVGVHPSLLDQVCVYHLGMTLPVPSDTFDRYSKEVREALKDRAVNLEHSLPEIAHIAWSQTGPVIDFRGSVVVRYTSGSVELILIRTTVDNLRDPWVEYMFWRMDYEEETWTLSTAGMNIVIDGPGENAKWICTPCKQAKRWDVQFEFMEHDASVGADLQSYLRLYYSAEVKAAFDMNAQRQLEAALVDISDDEEEQEEMEIDG